MTFDPRPATDRTPFRADVQGLRAIAVAAVVLYHAGIPGITGGYTGVDVFFVISGFLITSHLLKALRETGRVHFASFYARRARRILPASFVVLALTAVAAFLLVSPLRLVDVLKDATATALYVPNINFAIQQTDYLADASPSPFQHYWSLGVEEQFYLFWPLLLLGLFFLARRSSRWLTVSIAIVVVASFVACLVVGGVSQPWAFFSLPTRAWELGAGGLIACAAPLLAKIPPLAATIGAWLGIAAVIGSAVLFTPETPYPSALTVIPVLGAAAMIGLGAQANRWGPARALSIRPLQFLGLISYSLYLVHWPLIVLYTEYTRPGGVLPLLDGVILVTVCLPLAWLLFRFVETPLRVKSGARPRARRALVLTVATSVALAIVFVGGQSAVARLPLDSGRPAASPALSRMPAGTAFVPDNITPTLAKATADTGELYTDGCQQSLSVPEAKTCSFGTLDSPFTIALFGDSHAGRWFPALKDVATSAGVRLVTYTKSGCRSEETTALWGSTDNPSCAEWRVNALAALAADPPDLIVLANHLGPTPGHDPAILERDWTDGLTTTIGRLPSTSRVVMLADSPEFPFSSPMCLSSHLRNTATCAVSRTSSHNPSIVAAERTVSAKLGAGLIDLTDYFCNADTCPPVIGSTLVYSDEHHMTATFSRLLAKPLGEALAPYLPAQGQR